MLNLPNWPRLPIWQIEKRNDLQLMQTLLRALEYPHKNLPPTIHIAGTNGKGSSVAMLRSVFEAANYIVHTYSSTHLI